MVVITNFDPNLYLLMGTRNGEIKKTSLDHFTAVRSSGLIGMDVEKDDELTSARIATEQDDVVMVTQKGQSIRFPVESIRTSQRTSGGVKGIKLFDGDVVVGMGIASPGSYVLVVSTEGYGKLTQIDRYPKQHRAGSGVRTIKLVDKTGELADARIVSPSQQVMFISANGIVTRTPVKEISILDRSTQGVRLMRMDEGDHVVAVAHMETT
jgi:DNA gyrase subunit A